MIRFVIILTILSRVNCTRPHSQFGDRTLQHGENDTDITQIRAAVVSLTSEVDAFLAQPHVQVELAEVAQLPLAHGLIERGLSIRHRFRLFVITYLLRNTFSPQNASSLARGAHLEKEVLMQHDASDVMSNLGTKQGSDVNESLDRKAWMWKTGVGEEDSFVLEKRRDNEFAHGLGLQQRTANDASSDSRKDISVRISMTSDQTAACDTLIQGQITELEPPPDQKKTFEAALQNFCKLETVSRVKSELPSEEVMKELGAEDLLVVSQGPYNINVVKDQRKARQLKGAKKTNWVESNHDQNNLDTAKRLYTRATVMRASLQNIADVISVAQSVTWFEVEKKGSVAKRSWKAAVEKVKTVSSNVATKLKSVWAVFKKTLRGAEEKCRKEGEEKTKLAAEKTGLHKDAKAFADMDAAKIEEQAAKVDSTIDVIVNPNGQARTDADNTLKNSIKQVRRESESLEAEVHKGTDPQHFEEVVNDAEKIDDAIGKLETNLCESWTEKIMRTLKASFEKAKKTLSSAAGTVGKVKTMPKPTLGIRGLSAQAGIFSAGLEEVIDFRNLEIAQFRWGASFFGPGGTGGSVGGYVGIGWKGYKYDWTLEEAYVTGLWMAYSVTPNFFGLGVGAGMTVCTDADNSGPGPWVPEPHGINSVLFGWSVSASLANVVLPVSQDYGASYYQMINSECYSKLEEFIEHIWRPMCDGCDELVEKDFVENIRMGINALTFWPLNNVIFSVLAYLYDKAREPEYTPVCSPRSNNNRNKVDKLLEQVAMVLSESSSMLVDAEKRLSDLKTAINEAKSNTDLPQSLEYETLKKGVDKFLSKCASGEPEPCDKIGQKDDADAILDKVRRRLVAYRIEIGKTMYKAKECKDEKL